MKKSLELNKIVEEIKDIVEKGYVLGSRAPKCGCDQCIKNDIPCSNCSICQENMSKNHQIYNESNDLTKSCDCEKCKTEKMNCEECPDCVTKSYNSDNEDEDKWDNMEKACWSGYTQRGMKEKNGKMVPNCVPIKKSLFGTDGPQTLIPRNK